MRPLRVVALLIVTAGLIDYAASGDWPSLHSIVVRLGVGVAVGVLAGLILRSQFSVEERRALIARMNPRLAEKMRRPPPNLDDDHRTEF